MSGSAGKVYALAGNQRAAADPRDNVWLSASAGTGKTQVLSARVLRLLLRQDVAPDQVLCLTFTKAGAAEMANRINAVLARWVRLESTALAKELSDLGADMGPDTQTRARSLFASVLDCPGGGLRIDTIHAFAQFLLTNFPGEAELAPGARPMEERERDQLAREVLTELLTQARETDDQSILQAVERFVTAKSPDELRQWLMLCVKLSALWEGPDGWQSPVRPRVCANLGIPSDADRIWVSQALHPDVFPDHQLQAILATLQQWKTKTGQECCAIIGRWLATSEPERLALVDDFFGSILTKKGEPKSMATPEKLDPLFRQRQQELADAVALIRERQTLVDLADMLAPALELGRAFVLKWNAAKARDGLLEFDDLIERAAGLLANSDAADWIRYKLDRQFDHILIDEAQDTNRQQWDIVFALIDDFFAGESAAGDKLRTIFTVGDYKQAIFGFQGTSPENFRKARNTVRAQIEAARAHAGETRDQRNAPRWQELDLGQSYRTSDVVLRFVDRAIETIGAQAFGLDSLPEPHHGSDRPGLVTLWGPVNGATGANSASDDENQPDWFPDHERALADRIAEQVRRWHSGDEPLVLAKNKPNRQAKAGDVMVLVRKRGALAALIVARLHAKGVPVAGVDRLRLGAPLAVQDLLAALRFAAQPLDDLSLANVLTSPLIGWSQEELLAWVPRKRGTPLWDHLRQNAHPRVDATVQLLRELLARVDFDTPQALLSWLLVGPWQGRSKLVARLGVEANDPIDELLNSAFAFEAGSTPSLAGFLEWMDASDAELKRESGEAEGQVQVLTVHGSKGLQRPIVILADATAKPRSGGASELDEIALEQQTGRRVPLPPLSQSERVGRLRVAENAKIEADMEEHWRLLYVAMTRAEEGLFIGGALGPQQAKNGPHEDSWYAKLEHVFPTEPLEDGLWGHRLEWGYRSDRVERWSEQQTQNSAAPPQWLTKPVGPEPRPPRPLAPSSAADDRAAHPPIERSVLQSAARRGILIHRLLERLPAVPCGARRERAAAWLEKQANDLTAADKDEIVASAVGVLENPDFADVFAEAGLAEVPLAAVVDGQVIAGTVDRLLVTPKEVVVLDYKTTRRPPASASEVPAPVMQQMAAYALALEVIYPGRQIRAGVLYTHAPRLIELNPNDLSSHKHKLSGTQESYPM